MQEMEAKDVNFLNLHCSGNYSDEDYDAKALHIFFTNSKVNDHNEKTMKILENEGNELVTVIAKDSIATAEVDERTKISLLSSLREKPTKDTQGLSYSLKLVKEGRVAITSNVDTLNGIANGSMGVVKYFTRAKTGQVKIIWIQLDNPHDGISYREKYVGLYKRDKNISKNWTPMFAQAKSFNIGGRGRGRKYFEVCRIQFPLVSAFARTLWKVQGATRHTTTYIDFNDEYTSRGNIVKRKH